MAVMARAEPAARRGGVKDTGLCALAFVYRPLFIDQVGEARIGGDGKGGARRGGVKDTGLMAPPWGLSTPRAPKELFNYFFKSDLVTKQVFFLRISHHILHAQNCDHFQCFPHTPMPPGPSK